MPAPVPLPIRIALWRRHEQGASAAELGRAFGLAPRTVRGLLRRGRERGEAGLAPDYRRAPGPPPPPAHPAYEPAVALRREHPGWGAALIRIYLEDRGVRPLPSTRSLQQWFRRAGIGPAPPGRRPAAPSGRAAAPHEVWEVDAAEEIPLADGSAVSWLRVADEFTGAVLHTAVFPPGALELGPGGRRPGPAPRGVRPLGAAGAGARR